MVLHTRLLHDALPILTGFFDKWAKGQVRCVPGDEGKQGFVNVDPKSAERRQADIGIECIGCAICYSACDVVGWNPDYLGPAALNRAWTLVNDARDGDRQGHLAAVAVDAGCHRDRKGGV